jgi:hypothetical protein
VHYEEVEDQESYPLAYGCCHLRYIVVGCAQIEKPEAISECFRDKGHKLAPQKHIRREEEFPSQDQGDHQRQVHRQYRCIDDEYCIVSRLGVVFHLFYLSVFFFPEGSNADELKEPTATVPFYDSIFTFIEKYPYDQSCFFRINL